MYLLLKMSPNFDLQYQIDPNPENLYMAFSLSFGHDYSPLNSAKLSCSSEVTLLSK